MFSESSSRASKYVGVCTRSTSFEKLWTSSSLGSISFAWGMTFCRDQCFVRAHWACNAPGAKEWYMFGPRCGFVVVECRPPTLEKSTNRLDARQKCPILPLWA